MILKSLLAGDVKIPKPDPEGLLTTIQKLQCLRSAALYVGDSIIDARAAQAAGVKFIEIGHGSGFAGRVIKPGRIDGYIRFESIDKIRSWIHEKFH